MAKFAINLKSGKVEQESDVIIGIDLGTTNSLVAYIKEGVPTAVKGADQNNTLVPSVLHFGDDQTVVVGDAAKEKLITHPQQTIYSVKRLMGKNYTDVGNQQYFGYQVIDDEDDHSLVKIRVGDTFYTPVELSAKILRELKRRIEQELKATVTRAVITVPAYFNDAQRQATRDAGKLAGLNVLRIVNEPTAASLAYGIGQQSTAAQTIAVYDLGGGTFDISILQIDNGIFEVLSTNGDTFLGGDDFDHAIINFWLQQHELTAAFLEEDKSLGQQWRLAAEMAKKTLSTSDTFETKVGNHTLNIDKLQFENAISPLVQRTIQSCKLALKDAKRNATQIDHVVMVGGSTRVPLVKRCVSDFFGQQVYDKLNPDEVVALGAAIQADVLAGNQKEVLLLDITPLSLGIETVGGLMDTIIPRNSKVPTAVGRDYTTSVDGQRNLKVAVYQGERDLVQDNRKLGEFILRDIPPMPAGLPKIEISFLLDADGILQVRAREKRSNVEQRIEIKSSYGISEEEMAKMLIDSLQHAEGDLKKRALVEARNEANNILLSADKFIIQNKEILSEEEIQQTRTLVADLRKQVSGTDKDAINKSMATLNEYTAPLAHRAMDVNIQKAMKGQRV